MLAGYWNYCTGYVKGFLSYRRDVVDFPAHSSPLDDPEILLQQAQWEMKENQARNRSRMVEVITLKNNLQALADQQRKRLDNLQDKIEFMGDDQVVHRLQAQRERLAATLATTEESLRFVAEVSETVKIARRREEQRVHAKTAQALALKALWNQCQIETLIAKAASDPEEGLTQIGYLTRALILHARKVRDDLTRQAEQAAQSGNEALADRLRAARDEFQSGLCA
ncbi:MAG: hypothetical protein M3Y13_15715 [Armatimonadota bacterium]|nr:hypothetical protein [Armatimonadota bacterium]